MIRTKGFRCHITTLLGLALPGIDANDLEKSLHSLAFIQSVCYNIPFEDLTQGREDVNGNMLAMQWITGELERMEEEGAAVEMNYDTDLSDEVEERILRSSTTGFGEFLISFLGRVFTLLENLPDAARVRSGSPEENVLNTLPATFTPLLASLSPELYDVALHKIVDFVAEHVIHQARDAVAFICNALCKVNPEKALKRFIPLLIRSIRTEIDENGAASTRTTGSDVLPRDRGLVWNVSMLSIENSRIKRDGSGKDWSDEVTRNIILLRLIISGISALFNNRIASSNKSADSDVDMADADDSGELLQQSDPDSVLDTSDEATIRRTFTYPTGYSLTDDDPLCIKLHDIRERIGQVLHNVHRFLVEKQGRRRFMLFAPIYRLSLMVCGCRDRKICTRT
ncbi:proteasome activator complex subunit 4 [Coccidioides immitis H538.4]|uniref:Proteasome activator complex subunit 4 n=1 Tax=Coccidioides immitis H538.4 TaxID=396776 RepID=A0A0J8UN10_COCIT|nr:proteasome activator complex subunit 4 [Coccidioides immitis H538.4]